MEHLSKLFGSPARVKLLRLFLFNPAQIYDRDMVVVSARVTPDTASKELATLARAGIINRKSFFKEVIRAGTKLPTKRRTLGWVLNTEYPHLTELTRFFRDTLTVSDAEMRKRMKNIGPMKLVVIAGFLIGEEEGSVLDLLVVGDRVDEAALKSVVRVLESESGRELRYAVLTNDEYQYRRRVRDKLMRDVFDFPHREIVNKLGVA
jgi:hypothetical protein